MSIEKIVFSFLVSLVLEACSEDNNMVVNDPLGETNAPASSGDVASVSSGDAVLVSSSSGEPVLGDERVLLALQMLTFLNRFIVESNFTVRRVAMCEYLKWIL